MKVASKTWIPLAVALFLAPVIGGQLFVDALKIDPGVGTLSLVMKGAPETPWLSHAYLSLFVVASALWLAFGQKVIAIPKVAISILAFLFGTCLLMSVANSQFKLVSTGSLIEWLIYLVAFFVAAAAAGRGKGSRFLIGSIVAGCTIVALMGILEYGQMRTIDPTWRIFASWVNSNALAGMLLIGFLLALGLVVIGERLTVLLSAIATCLIGAAIVLSQSRGALIYSLPVGLVVLLVGTLSPKGSVAETGIRGLRMLSVLAACAVLVGAITLSGKKTGGTSAPTALARVSTQSDHAREQSSSFRLMLWKSCAQLMKENPGGYGIGTFRYEGSRPGLVVPTHLAHQSFLQLGVEANPVAPILLVAIGLFWLFYMLRGVRNAPFELSGMRIAIVAAVSASVVHNLFDSDLYMFGIGLTFFALLGIGLSAAADGVSPEFLPAPIRISFPIFATALVIGLGFLGVQKLNLSLGLGLSTADSLGEAQERFDKGTNANIDGEAFYLKSRITQDGSERLALLKRAAALSPSPKYYRALSREQFSAGNTLDSIDALTWALKRDPNNLQTLSQLLEIYVQTGDSSKAKETAERTVAVESSPSYSIRAISEVVPTETYVARCYLADQESNSRMAADLLKPAVDGYREYAKSTVPRILQLAKDDPAASFAGETLQSAEKAMDKAQTAAQMLMNSYRALNDRAGVAEAGEALAVFKEASDSLRSISR